MSNITIDSNLIECAKNLLDDKDIKRAAKAAVKRAVTAARTAAAKEIRKDYTVKSAEVKINIRHKVTVTPEGICGAVIGEGARLKLDKFKVFRNARSPMSVKVLKRKRAAKMRGLFFGHTTKGDEAPFLRTTKNRKPINMLYGPSLPEMMQNKDVLEFMAGVAQETLNKRFEHEINYRLSQKGSK